MNIIKEWWRDSADALIGAEFHIYMDMVYLAEPASRKRS
jgi:hypothetical protein